MAFGLIAQGHGRLLQRPTAHWLLEGSPENSSSWEGISSLLQPIWASGVSHREVSNRKALVHKLLPLWGMWDSCRGRQTHLVDFKGGYQWPILGNKQHLHREHTGNSLFSYVFWILLILDFSFFPSLSPCVPKQKAFLLTWSSRNGWTQWTQGLAKMRAHGSFLGSFLPMPLCLCEFSVDFSGTHKVWKPTMMPGCVARNTHRGPYRDI